MKAKQFIKDCTRSYNNACGLDKDGALYFHEWLTPDEAERAAEIAIEEMIEKACKWLLENKEHPFIGCEDPCLSGYLTDEFIEDFKKAMEE